MKDLTSKPGEIVASIRPGPNGEPPVFRIVRREARIAGSKYGGTERDAENVRPCEHRKFILDEKFATVTCQECKTRVDPFAALMLYADWFAQLKQQEMMTEHAEKGLIVTGLRRLHRLRALTDEERAEVKALIDKHWAMELPELKAAHDKFDRVVWDRRITKQRVRAV